ncbi:PREDICTED: uncharacterized protein F13E9.13, mitochondrial-like isoform X2 [Priapulus caudatus]|uniref:Uncharacterized protein F13E9.13, mitochondrial-like isoform X2 n=1 Tax=Priapulus caudatus TaxID=37621 RepID=A0ABM1EW62_PRICU|nr:PREDICTED: uncharacterized protein F13E9.13, mitochondrial-like isoform X2 [Priapulus caudatus]
MCRPTCMCVHAHYNMQRDYDCGTSSPRFDMSMEKIVSAAKREAEMYLDAKVDGVCIENMHDVPYLHSDRVGPETVAAMTRVAATVRAAAPSLPLGVQILAAANTQAMAVARAAGTARECVHVSRRRVPRAVTPTPHCHSYANMQL